MRCVTRRRIWKTGLKVWWLVERCSMSSAVEGPVRVVARVVNNSLVQEK
jgi:hypothetical protein